MSRTTALLSLSLMILGAATTADAQGRGDRGNRNEIARAQGVPPGQVPPPDLCRVWYENRSAGRQPSATNCRQAEAIAARDRNARVIYGADAYSSRNGLGRNDDWRQNDDYRRNDDWRTGRDRDSAGIYDRARTPAYESGYRDGLQRGREDASRRNTYDLNRHGWYRSANRGYDNRYGSRTDYERWYREGFESGYTQSYRGDVRR